MPSIEYAKPELLEHAVTAVAPECEEGTPGLTGHRNLRLALSVGNLAVRQSAIGEW